MPSAALTLNLFVASCRFPQAQGIGAAIQRFFANQADFNLELWTLWAT
jgi:hypothetical protein